MPEIGATLREARARQRVDIAEIEVDTKIRAKYLRALENEEWDLLPGTTYVKSFLRTYAEALGLDGRLLVEEYKLRHERLSDVELQPISPRSTQPTRGRRSRGVPRWLVVSVVVAGLVVALYFLGSNEDQPRSTATDPPTQPTGSGAQGSVGDEPAAGAADDAQRQRERERERRESRRSRIVRLQIVPLGPVFVCLTAAGRGTVIDGVELQPGDAMRSFRSRRFRLTLGNDRARLRINGRLRAVPAVTNGIGYEITRNGRRTLSASDRPTCT